MESTVFVLYMTATMLSPVGGAGEGAGAADE
ncbi:hypothetical protein ABIC28_004357 [Rhodococcus sp. PvR044]